MRIGSFDTDERVLVVAEIGNNHEGDVAVARRLVERAADAGVDAVKLQTFRTEEFVSPSDPERYARMKRFELPVEAWGELCELAHGRGLLFFSTPLDMTSFDVLAPLVDAFKIASGDIDFFPLLERVGAAGKPVVAATGQSDLDDVARAVAVLGPRVALLHCVTSYPAPEEEVNLRGLRALAERFPEATIGYSDHTIGLDAAPLAVACGARIVEKHFTLDRHFSPFRDHQLSVDPAELDELVRRVRAAEVLLGDERKEVQPSELEMRTAVRRSVAAARALPAGHVVTRSDLIWTRPADGLRPGEEASLLGRPLRHGVEAGQHLLLEDIL